MTLLTSNTCITFYISKIILKKNEKHPQFGPGNMYGDPQCRPRTVVVFLTIHLENDNRAKFWIIFPDSFHKFQNVLLY